MLISKNTPQLNILGFGNALMDIMIPLPDDTLLQRFDLPRGSMTLVDQSLSSAIYQATANFPKEITAGGSAANTIHTFASLGGKCAFAGKIGKDELGQRFGEELHQYGIDTFLPHGKENTGRVMALVSPDSERTMATYLGAAIEMEGHEVSVSMMKGYNLVYVEGYLVQNHELIESIFKTAKACGMQTAIDLASYNVVEQNLEFLQRIVREYVDILFANEEEAFAFTGLKPEQALEQMASACSLAVVKLGKHGSIAQRGAEKVMIEPVSTQAVDTTGAGDSYAAGFLFGLSKGATLGQCGAIASLVSSKAVESMGARIPSHDWPALLREVDSCLIRE